MVWQAVIFGPDDTPWEGGTFKLLLEFTEDYPNKPPAVKFLSKIFHPNVYGDGKICLDILQNQWSPIYDIAAVLTSIQSLLSDPNPASPANAEASQLYERDRREYNKRVRVVVEESWMEDGVMPDDDDLKSEDMPLGSGSGGGHLPSSSSTASMSSEAVAAAAAAVGAGAVAVAGEATSVFDGAAAEAHDMAN